MCLVGTLIKPCHLVVCTVLQHHCWCCGEVYCTRCIERCISLAGHDSRRPVPVCKACYKRLRRSPASSIDDFHKLCSDEQPQSRLTIVLRASDNDRVGPHTIVFWSIPQCGSAYHRVDLLTQVLRSIPQCESVKHRVCPHTIVLWSVPQCGSAYHRVGLLTQVLQSIPQCESVKHRVGPHTIVLWSITQCGLTYHRVGLLTQVLWSIPQCESVKHRVGPHTIVLWSMTQCALGVMPVLPCQPTIELSCTPWSLSTIELCHTLQCGASIESCLCRLFLAVFTLCYEETLTGSGLFETGSFYP